jgi:hypothetical protein
MALTARIAEESTSVIDHLRAVRAALYQLFDLAVTAGDTTGGAQLAGKLLQCLDSMGRITGQLASSPLVQINQTNIFMHDPAFARFQADLIRVLGPFADARKAVIAEFSRLEAEPVTAIPALEHQTDVEPDEAAA